MDYSCKDIPMRLDIRYQPLNFEIYLSQVIDVPRTSLEEQPYDFRLEIEALERVDQILEQTRQENEKLRPQEPIVDHDPSQLTKESSKEHQVSHQSDACPNDISITLPPPSCPTETPLTPIKSVIPNSLSNTDTAQPKDSTILNQINPQDFEEMHYNPFDHLALQTIDELRELDLVFQASYANQTPTNQLQQTANSSSASQNNSNPLTKL